MKIAIVTLPMHTNYGGILQAYALKSFLVAAGHDVDVLDPKVKMPLPKWWKAPFVYASRAFKRVLKGASGPEVFRELRFKRELPYVGRNTLRFVNDELATRQISDYQDVHTENFFGRERKSFVRSRRGTWARKEASCAPRWIRLYPKKERRATIHRSSRTENAIMFPQTR